MSHGWPQAVALKWMKAVGMKKVGDAVHTIFAGSTLFWGLHYFDWVQTSHMGIKLVNRACYLKYGTQCQIKVQGLLFKYMEKSAGKGTKI